nr:immunoglobulin heavy chain junction region [Macaca mulatta]MOW98769.1 immunoglobulin heavy chain junction region [Macaca mulatta]MOW98836.1 immunoglobulin heavy chain junction region [Macaca mulatta]MOW99054.1 immunoglobulin heavy chain junction region [Macaca mulatta]MOX00143.1 immunoglobulin heavy chain junction region [Macaca mulatta]
CARGDVDTGTAESYYGLDFW